jgi:protein ImuB
MLPDKPPSWIDWRKKSAKIIHGTGPERIAPEWWSGDVTTPAGDRDYFKVQTENGAWLWVFRDNRTHTWFVHGVWV